MILGQLTMGARQAKKAPLQGEIVWPQYKWEGGARAGGSFQANFLCQSLPQYLALTMSKKWQD